MVFSFLTNNIFKAETRRLPVEFPYKNTFKLIVSLNIPEGFEVVSLPQSQRVGLQDGTCECMYVIGVNGQRISLQYTVVINGLYYSSDNYDELRHFFGLVADKNKAIIELVKKVN